MGGPIIVGVPVVEEAVARLSYYIERLAADYGSVGIPLPEGLCRDIASGVKVARALPNYMNDAQGRVWSYLAYRLEWLASASPGSSFKCYLGDEAFKAQREVGHSLAGLVIREKLRPCSTSTSEWLSIYRRGPSSLDPGLAARLKGLDVVVADGYAWTLRILELMGADRCYAIEPLIPTPLDVLSLAAGGLVDPSIVGSLKPYIVRYVGEYIMGSRDLTEAYLRLVRDSEYLEFLESSGLAGLLKPRPLEEVILATG